jgi:hypothetical protein
MGWVKQRFIEESLYSFPGHAVRALWDTFRDSIGLAIEEYNDAVAEADRAISRDCTSRGPYCVRIRREAKGESWELFLNRENRRLDKSSGPEGQMSICGYRLTQDSKGLEFYSLDESFIAVPNLPEDASEANMTLTAEQVCEMAIRDLLFDPMPSPPYRLRG